MPTPGEQLDQTVTDVVRLAGDMATLGEAHRQLRQQVLSLTARLDKLEGKPPSSGSNPPPPPVTPGRIDWKRAPAKPSGDGMAIRKGGTYSGLGFSGWNQNIIIDTDGDVVLEDFVSVRALRDDKADIFVGQGLYIERAKSVTLRRCLFAYNGWNATDLRTKNGYRHGVYSNVGCQFLRAMNCLFAGNASCGLQTRGDSETIDCLFVGNSIGLAHVKGKHKSTGCDWYDGDYHAENEAGVTKAWTGNTAIQTYDALTLDKARIRAREGQGTPRSPKSSNMGAVNLATDHAYNPGSTGSLTATGCTLSAWPGGNFTGAKIHNGSGFNLVPGISNYEWRQDVDAVIAGAADVPAAIKRIREGAWK